MLNIGQLLNLTQEQVLWIIELVVCNYVDCVPSFILLCFKFQAKLAVTKNCESLIKHAKARRLKFIPVEVLPSEEVYKRSVFLLL